MLEREEPASAKSRGQSDPVGWRNCQEAKVWLEHNEHIRSISGSQMRDMRVVGEPAMWGFASHCKDSVHSE